HSATSSLFWKLILFERELETNTTTQHKREDPGASLVTPVCMCACDLIPVYTECVAHCLKLSVPKRSLDRSKDFGSTSPLTRIYYSGIPSRLTNYYSNPLISPPTIIRPISLYLRCVCLV